MSHSLFASIAARPACVLVAVVLLQAATTNESWAEANRLTDTCKVKCLANQTYNPAVDGKAGLCDVYLPESDPPSEGRPVVVVIHGGAWISGDKWTLEGYSRLLARHGFAVVTINYRHAPKHKFPKQVDDVRQALIWTTENAERFSINLDQLGLFGYSAGGHLAAMVGNLVDEPMEVRLKTSQWNADDRRWKKLPKIHALCLGGPPCDFRSIPIDSTGMSFFLGGSRRQRPEVYAAASPANHVSPSDPTTQIIHGDDDFIVPIAGSRAYYTALRKLGVDTRFNTVAGQGHMATFLNMNTRQTVLEFFQSVFVKPLLSHWNLNELSATPPMKWLDETSPIRELTYEGQPSDDQPTDVFAFYATPGTIAGDPSLDKDLPAVVLIHGGGGTAFADWVWLWAKRGYAAIAMDLSGSRPESPTFNSGELVSKMKLKRTRLDRGGPNHGRPEKFDSVGDPIDDDWPYHAVGNVIRAHSLVRSFDEINPEKTAVTGISWGGYTTCIVASVDDRFKAAVPVYGCGFLYEGESVQRPSIDALTTEKRSQWIAQYDPSSHLRHCRVPMLFVNGTSDKHYTLPSYQRSYDVVPGKKQMRIEVKMPHSHQAGWKPNEIGLFIDSHLTGGQPLAKLASIKETKEGLRATATFSGELAESHLHYTTGTGPLVKREWKTVDAELQGKAILASKPDDATIYFMTATDKRGAMVSTEVVFPRSTLDK